MATVTTAPALVRPLTNHPPNQPTNHASFICISFLHSYKAKKKKDK
jgi:hypothetical protein